MRSMAVTKTPRRAWVDAGLEALAEGGLAEVRIEVLARRLKVTKGGFYGFFDDRPALLAAMLETWEQTVTVSVTEQVDAAAATDPRARLARLIAIIDDQSAPAMRIGTELAIRDWARHDEAAARTVRRVDRTRGDYLRDLFRGFCSAEEAAARTTIAMSVRLGAQLMDLGTDDTAHLESLELIQQRLLA
ncbi:TetR family transcriptional regulator [Enemella evansiae]|nr:TetR family transcriptional regulator [Enemella evansiae]